MSKYIVISDSHSDPHPSLFSKLKNVDGIIHCGDISTIDVIDDLKKFAPVYAVSGNVESFKTDNQFEERKYLEFENLKILVIHDLGTNIKYFHEHYIQTKYPEAQLVLFGHTHIAFKKKYKKTTFFNPGSIGPPRYNKFPTYGILNINRNGKFKISHHKIFDLSLVTRFFS